MTDREPILVEKLFPPGMRKEEAIRIAIGAASVCWEKMEGTGVFQSERALEIAEQLREFLELPNELNPDRSKGERIVHQCLENGEPFFVFRARDIFTIMVLKHYIKIVEDYGPDDPDFQWTIVHFINELKDWQRAHVGQVRYPD
jgi:hypothetical protein